MFTVSCAARGQVHIVEKENTETQRPGKALLLMAVVYHVDPSDIARKGKMSISPLPDGQAERKWGVLLPIPFRKKKTYTHTLTKTMFSSVLNNKCGSFCL